MLKAGPSCPAHWARVVEVNTGQLHGGEGLKAC